MKKIMYPVIIIIGFIIIHLSFRYILNEVYINNYNNGNYSNSIVNFLKILNYPESYIAHYNKGNNYYNLKEYENAIEEYNKALRTVKGSRKCKVLINLSLSKFELIDLNQDIARDKLLEIQNILLEDSCATRDNKGKDSEAQKLYNEIEALLNSKGGGGSGGDPQDNPPDNPNDNPQNYDELQKKLREQQQKASNDRKTVNKRDYEYYNGKNW